MPEFLKLLDRLQEVPYFKRRVLISKTFNPKPSRFLYKYRTVDENDTISMNRLRDIIVKSKLWLSSPIDFNDPFDMSGKISVAATADEKFDRINKLIKDHKIRFKERKRKRVEFMRMSTEALGNKVKSIFNENTSSTGVYSFAGDAKNILMWSHYAKDHTGICIQFERARDFRKLSGAISVDYSLEYPELNWIKASFQNDIKNVLLRKHVGWSYEQESRIIKIGDAHKYLHFDPQAVVGIILGCRITEKKRMAIEELLKERYHAGLPSVRLYSAQKHDSRYQLMIKRL